MLVQHGHAHSHTMRVKQASPRRMWVRGTEDEKLRHYERIRRFVATKAPGLPPFDTACIANAVHVAGDTCRWAMTMDDGVQLKNMTSLVLWWTGRCGGVKAEDAARPAQDSARPAPDKARVTYDGLICNINSELIDILHGLEGQLAENAVRVQYARSAMDALPANMLRIQAEADADVPTLTKYGLQAAATKRARDLQRAATEAAETGIMRAAENFGRLVACRDALKAAAVSVKRLRESLSA